MSRHYLDYNATAPMRDEAIAAMSNAMQCLGNPSSIHAEGREALALVENARASLRKLVNAPVNGIIFTSGGTEAIHHAVNGTIGAGLVRRLFVSAIEHAAVIENADAAGTPVEVIPVLPSGIVDLDWLRTRLENYDAEQEGGFLVCLMLANNETGVIQPVAQAAAIAHDAGGLMFTDAAQAAGKIPVNFTMLGADIMSVTAHKFGGPLGVGALIVEPNLALCPIMRGGGQELNRRAGTQNVPAIAGFGAACEAAFAGLLNMSAIAGLRDEIEQAVAGCGGRIWGGEGARLPGTLCFSAPGFSAETQVMTLDLAGVAVSSGSACSSGKVTPSHVLTAMGARDEDLKSAVRVSLGWNSNADDAAAFIAAWRPAYDRIKAKAA